MGHLYQSILETIGRTPVVRLNKIAPEGINLYVKIESFNPMGSVKDRLALGVVEQAEQSGALQPGQTVIEATSGNTGIGLAMVCAHKGYPLVVTMAESFSVERRRMMRFLGARVVLTPAELKGSGMLAKATELADKHGWFLCRQFENEANADAHSRTTAPEILADFEGERLDYWVTGFGTGGTLKGVMQRIIAEAGDGPDYLYISFDIDVLDPAFTPGTGTPEPGGLTPREVFPLVRRLCAENNLVGFDLVEFNPLADPGYTTALTAGRVLRECLTGIAMKKKGITDKNYRSPLTLNDGHDD